MDDPAGSLHGLEVPQHFDRDVDDVTPATAGGQHYPESSWEPPALPRPGDCGTRGGATVLPLARTA